MDKSIKRVMRLGENSLRGYFGKIEGIDVNAPKQFANEHCGLVLRLDNTWADPFKDKWLWGII
ncbi:hypothetical protein MGMO_171c00210 [Methyloglobulus morosus KoM1]|uniref:Uncharacterized protein n=1 Tax=Methyloglobulus morosus KoM1 TaxID=1116472 RepID=V5BHG5_9GAMM|nr:hypothetical protein [Methyloglobulus morosus]ESS67179.1 hypothetical protein MGMO_171c00210 [Methyloglobulus morosus KoM1]